MSIKRYFWDRFADCNCNIVERHDGAMVDYDDHIAAVAELEARCAALAAENAGLKEYRPQPGGAAMMEALDAFEAQDDYPEGGMMDAFDILCCKRVKTPATDAFLAEVRAQAIRDALDESSDYLDTDCVMDRLDISYEDAELRTSGAIELHDALVAVANQLRKGE